MSSRDLTELASDLVSDGFAGHEAAVREVVRAARIARLSTVLVDVLADPREPEVARLRAFGRLSARLALRKDVPPAAASAAA